MSEKKFDPAKPVMTRDGRKARIIATDRKHQFPIAALVFDKTGMEDICGYTSNGSYLPSGSVVADDLINVPEVKSRWSWLVMPRFGGHSAFGLEGTYHSIEDAKREQHSSCAGLYRFDLDESGTLTMHKEEA